ncbi:hypothetical protein HDU93_003256 [Gonapodya sp. JEL0774]|nr:hypothetical protein HDU93_003256 [Gonapodya sp. JEL0774]
MPSAVETAAPSIQQSLSVILKTIDGSSFTVPFSTVRGSATVTSFVEGKVAASPKALERVEFDVPHTTPDILQKVLGYLADHENDAPYDEEVRIIRLFCQHPNSPSASIRLSQTYQSDPVKDGQYKELEDDEIMQFLMATQLLGIGRATHMAAEIFAERINGKSEEEILGQFNPDELEEVEEMDEDEEEDDE